MNRREFLKTLAVVGSTTIAGTYLANYKISPKSRSEKIISFGRLFGYYWAKETRLGEVRRDISIVFPEITSEMKFGEFMTLVGKYV